MKRLLAFLPLALLAACSREEPAPEATASQPAAQATAAPGATPEPPQAALAEVPAAFRGYWDYVDGQCANWSDAQLTIEATRLTFYEGVGEVQAVRQPDANTVVLTLAMSGEGDTWQDEATYRLVDGGAVLESHFTEAEGGGEPFRRKRCDALVDVPME